MAVIRCHFFSNVLGTQTSLTIALPHADAAYSAASGPADRTLLPVMYVLHGGAEDSTMWLRRTHLEAYCQMYGFIAVSLDGQSGAYANMAHGYRYFDYLTRELPEFIEWLLPASCQREDRLIAGFSMGGQGALKAAFRCPERYAAAMPLCGARDVIALCEKWATMEHGPNMAGVWDALGPLETLRGGENDLVALARQASERKAELPRLLIGCARDDYAAELTEEYHQLLNELGIAHTYYQADGIHDYRFVDQALSWALEHWLPLNQPRRTEGQACI